MQVGTRESMTLGGSKCWALNSYAGTASTSTQKRPVALYIETTRKLLKDGELRGAGTAPTKSIFLAHPNY